VEHGHLEKPMGAQLARKISPTFWDTQVS
jgi:hypothetical protein